MDDKVNTVKEQIKTVEELLSEKKKAFEAEPDRFVDSKEVIIGVKRNNDKTIGIFINPTATNAELFIAQGELLYNVNKHLTARDVAAFQKAQAEKKIVSASGFNRHMRRGIEKIRKH